MKQVNELRVGNIIAKRTEVFTIKCATELVTIQRMPVPFKPVELTEEWLVKFGIIKIAYLVYMMGCFELRYHDKLKQWEVIIKGGILARLESVHQLQNLYFALTGKELTI